MPFGLKPVPPSYRACELYGSRLRELGCSFRSYGDLPKRCADGVRRRCLAGVEGPICEAASAASAYSVIGMVGLRRVAIRGTPGITLLPLELELELVPLLGVEPLLTLITVGGRFIG